MIWESKPWKDELLANARLLTQLQKMRRSERRSFAIERTLFVSVYIMRKLWEAGKLSSAWKERRISCVFHPPKGKTTDRLNWHRIDELYQLDTPTPESLTTIELCHRLIHSFVFVVVEAPKKAIAGFFFASDKTKHRGLWFVRLDDMQALLREAGRDYPSSSRMVRHPKTNEWIVWAGHGEPPVEWINAVKSLPMRA
jgi:hypothetical protein